MTPPIAQRQRDAAAALPAERVSMQNMAQAHGPAAHGTVLLLMAVPCLLPVPGVGAGGVGFGGFLHYVVRAHMNLYPALPVMLVCLSATAAPADSFATRVKLAKAAEASEEFKSYQPAMFANVGEHLANTMRSCFASIPNPNTDTFVLVADINPNGKSEAVEVQPSTKIAQCFATGFAAAEYPRPPVYPNRSGFPVTIEMRIKP